ncbi:MAG TPA: YceH family protein [Thermoanaerobaculia bacterium]|nr:YceH family protein [Thermoanaerobaculia bacterium]
MRLARELDPIEVRVLGSLVEKQMSTPEAYPLTVNSLVLACNQKSNREPVLELEEDGVRAALERLRELVLVWKVEGARSERWEHNLDARWELDRPRKALLALLFLRGAQTPGELRGRSERLHPFASLSEIESTLDAMSKEAEPLVFEIARRPGQKEGRWSHLVGSAPPGTAHEAPPLPADAEPSLARRIERLEALVAKLSGDLEDLRRRLGG